MSKILNRFRNKALWVSVLTFIPMLCQGFGWKKIKMLYKNI